MAIPTLKSIFEAITPENIKTIPIVQVGMEIFIDEIEKNSEIAKKIRSLYDNEIQLEDDTKVRNAKERIKVGLYNYYLYNLYNCLKNLTQSKSIQASLKKFGYDKSKLFNKANENINTEFISSFRNYTQKVGTENAMSYIYTFARYLETGELENDLNIQESGNPFIIHYEGALNRKIFEGINKPLSHPIGWCFTYTTMFTVMLRDYFGIEIVYIFTKLEIVSKDGKKFIVFTDKDVESVYEDFRNRINPETELPYTDDEIAKNVQIFIKKVKDYQYWDDGIYTHRLITFDDDTVLYIDGRTGVIFYTDYEDYVLGLKQPKSVFENHNFIAEMRSDIKFLYYDVINEFYKDFDISRIRDSDHQIGDSQYFADDKNNALNVKGDEYLFVPGYDESINKPIKYDLSEFNHQARIHYDQDYYGTLIIKDDYNNFKVFQCEKTGYTDLNTYELKGKNYSVWYVDKTFQKCYYRASGLNQIEKIKLNTPEIFTYTVTKKYGIKITGYTPLKETVIQIKDASLYKKSQTVNEGAFTIRFDTTDMVGGYCKIEAFNYTLFWYHWNAESDYDYENNEYNFSIDSEYSVIKKKNNIVFIEIEDLNDFDNTPTKISRLEYINIPDSKTVRTVPTFGTDKMARIDSKIGEQQIGKKIDGFYTPDLYLPDFVKDLQHSKIDTELWKLYNLQEITHKWKATAFDYDFESDFNLEILDEITLGPATPTIVRRWSYENNFYDYEINPYNVEILNDVEITTKDKSIANSIFKNKFVHGNIVEGEDYNKDYHDIYECTFIHRGYELTDIGTSDFIITDSTRYVNDYFEVSAYGSDYYFYTEDNNGSLDDYYLITNDSHYLVSRENIDQEVKLYTIKHDDKTIDIESNAEKVFIKFKNINAVYIELYQHGKNSLTLFKVIRFNKYRDEVFELEPGLLSYRIVGGTAIAQFDLNKTFNYTLRKVLLD